MIQMTLESTWINEIHHFQLKFVSIYRKEVKIIALTYFLATLPILATEIAITVNTKTREHGSQSSRKLKMAPVRKKVGSHFGSRTFWVNKIVLMFDITTNDVKSLRNPIRTKTVYIQHCTGTQMAWHT